MRTPTLFSLARRPGGPQTRGTLLIFPPFAAFSFPGCELLFVNQIAMLERETVQQSSTAEKHDIVCKVTLSCSSVFSVL